jgi:hypothetical protein
MKLTDDQIRAAYLKTGANYTMTEHHMRQAKLFIGFIFDVLEPDAHLDPDGTMHIEEWEASADCEPLYRRPE